MLRVGNGVLFTTVSHLFEEFEAANRAALAVVREGNSTVRRVLYSQSGEEPIVWSLESRSQ